MQSASVRSPWRRAMFLALLLALLCAWAWVLCARVWYVFRAPEAQEAAAAAFRRGVSFTDLTQLTAWDLTLPGTGGNPIRETAALSEVGGVPLPLVLLLAAGLLGVLGVLARTAILPVIAVMVANFGRSLVSALRVNMEDTAFIGPYMSATPSVAEFSLVCWMVVGTLCVLSLQIAYSNYRERKMKGSSSGAPPGIFDSMWSIQTAGMGRMNAPASPQPGVSSTP